MIDGVGSGGFRYEETVVILENHGCKFLAIFFDYFERSDVIIHEIIYRISGIINAHRVLNSENHTLGSTFQ